MNNQVIYPVTISGGHRGFNKVIWTVKEYVSGGDSPHITMYYHSFDGEQGKKRCKLLYSLHLYFVYCIEIFARRHFHVVIQQIGIKSTTA